LFIFLLKTLAAATLGHERDMSPSVCVCVCVCVLAVLSFAPGCNPALLLQQRAKAPPQTHTTLNTQMICKIVSFRQ